MIEKDNRIDDEEVEEENITSNANKKKILLIILPILIIIGLVVSFYAVFSSKEKNENKNYKVVEDITNTETSAQNSTIFYDLPEMDVLLNSRNNQQARAKIQITIESQSISADKIHILEAYIPKINDTIITHMVELYPDEIESSEGLYWLKEELLHRINLITHPILITSINFKRFEIQK